MLPQKTTLTYRNSNLPCLTSDSITIFQISKITRNNCYSWLLDGNLLLSISDSLKSTQLWEVSGSFFPCRFFLASAFSLIWFTQKGSHKKWLQKTSKTKTEKNHLRKTVWTSDNLFLKPSLWQLSFWSLYL